MRRDIHQLNEWLVRLNREHPFIFNLIALGIAFLIVATAGAILQLLGALN